MKLQLIRQQYKPDSTVGHLLVDGTFECFTLEDGVRTNKVHGRTCIPPGTYRMTIEPSPRFKKDLPRLHNVPNFQGVLIHTGNTSDNTEGCILVGASWQKGSETIAQSRVAFDALFPKLKDALARGDGLEIEVVQENAPADLLARAVRPMRGKAAAAKRKAAKPKAATRKTAMSSTAKSSMAKPKKAARPRKAAKPKTAARRAGAARKRATRKRR